MAMLRNCTGSECPAKPKWPLVRSLPGVRMAPMYSVTLLRSQSRITVPFNSTLIVDPLDRHLLEVPLAGGPQVAPRGPRTMP